MLEDECHLIDNQIAALMAINNNRMEQRLFDEFIEVQQQVRDLKKSAAEYQNKLNLVFDAISTELFKTPENESSIKNTYEPRITYLNDKMNSKVYCLYNNYIIRK